MKILFLEDRPSRQRIFLPHKDKDVQILKNFGAVYMPESTECKKIISSLNNSDYIIDENVRLIIIHGSALDTRGLQYLNATCNKQRIKLICFGGGVGQQIYNNEGFEYLNINSSDFYNKQLIPFLERFIMNEDLTLLEITNVNWQLTYLFQARQIINSLNEEDDDDRKLMFQSKLEQLQEILKLDDIINAEKINLEINKHILYL